MKKINRIASCMQGYVKPLKDSQDSVFAQGLSGDGVLIKPTYNQIIAPFSGQVVLVFESYNAIILRRESDGLALIIHVGFDTYKLTGKEFKVFVKNGDEVKTGDLLLEMDFKALEDIQYDYDTHVLFPALGNAKIVDIHYGEIDYMETLCNIKM